jgi:hypothetical protein
MIFNDEDARCHLHIFVAAAASASKLLHNAHQFRIIARFTAAAAVAAVEMTSRYLFHFAMFLLP